MTTTLLYTLALAAAYSVRKVMILKTLNRI
jgi:hypothetical protein